MAACFVVTRWHCAVIDFLAINTITLVVSLTLAVICTRSSDCAVRFRVAEASACRLAVIDHRAHFARTSVAWHTCACAERRTCMLAVRLLGTATLIHDAIVDFFAV